MIRYLYIIGLMIGCTGFSVQAKGITPVIDVPATNVKTKKTDAKSTASTSDKDKAKSTTASTSAPKSDTAKNTTAKTSSTTAASTSTKPASTPVQPAPTVAKSTFSSRPVSTSVASAHSYSSPSPSRTSHAAPATSGRLARVTAYWAGEGDYYTGKCMSSTGIHLHDGHCAVDPRIIPYGSTVEIAGVGKYLAVDTGSAVISREAARECARTPEERNALVIDVFFESRRDGQHFANNGPKYAAITWTSPRSTASTQETSALSAE